MVDAIKPVHPSGFIFPNTIGRALDLDNLADRVIRPTLKPHNLMWKGLAGISSRSRHQPQRVWSARHNYPVHFETREREYNAAFYIKTASAVAVDAVKKLEEKISGTVGRGELEWSDDWT